MTPLAIRTVSVRPMRARDLEAVAAIEAVVQSRPWSRQVFEEELARPDRVYLVAVARRGPRRPEVVGYAGALVAAGEAHVLTVAVHPDHRLRGAGHALVEELVAAVGDRGATAVTLEVRESNGAALALYERLGFVTYGLRPGYYQDTGEAARILWLHDVRHRGRDVPVDDAGRG